MQDQRIERVVDLLLHRFFRLLSLGKIDFIVPNREAVRVVDVVVGIRGVFHTDTGHKVTRHQKYEIAAKANFICRWIRWAIDIEIIIGDIRVGATGGEAVNEIPRGTVCLPYLPGGTAYPDPFRRFVITGSGFYQHNGNRCSSVCSGAAAQRQGAEDEIVIFLVRNFPGGDHFRLCQGQGSAEREKVILLPQSQISYHS